MHVDNNKNFGTLNEFCHAYSVQIFFCFMFHVENHVYLHRNIKCIKYL